jgi:hypothetical protein
MAGCVMIIHIITHAAMTLCLHVSAGRYTPVETLPDDPNPEATAKAAGVRNHLGWCGGARPTIQTDTRVHTRVGSLCPLCFAFSLRVVRVLCVECNCCV